MAYIPYYPTLACHMAPLPPGAAPLEGCDCRICEWARKKSWSESYMAGFTGPVIPGTPAWDALMTLAGAQL